MPLCGAYPVLTSHNVEVRGRACEPRALSQLVNLDTVYCYVGIPHKCKSYVLVGIRKFVMRHDITSLTSLTSLHVPLVIHRDFFSQTSTCLCINCDRSPLLISCWIYLHPFRINHSLLFTQLPNP